MKLLTKVVAVLAISVLSSNVFAKDVMHILAQNTKLTPALTGFLAANSMEDEDGQQDMLTACAASIGITYVSERFMNFGDTDTALSACGSSSLGARYGSSEASVFYGMTAVQMIDSVRFNDKSIVEVALTAAVSYYISDALVDRYAYEVTFDTNNILLANGLVLAYSYFTAPDEKKQIAEALKPEGKTVALATGLNLLAANYLPSGKNYNTYFSAQEGNALGFNISATF